MRKWIISVLIIGCIGWYFVNKPVDGPNIDVVELKKLLASDNDVILIDVRDPDEFAQMSIPGSILIPLGELDTSEKLKAIEKDKMIVMICQSGSRSAFAQQMLVDMGYKRVYNLSDGLAHWH